MIDLSAVTHYSFRNNSLFLDTSEMWEEGGSSEMS